jgi:hypothetical protein
MGETRAGYAGYALCGTIAAPGFSASVGPSVTIVAISPTATMSAF